MEIPSNCACLLITILKFTHLNSIFIKPFYKDLLPFLTFHWGGVYSSVSDWSISKKSSPLKPWGQMNPHLVGSIYERSSIKNAHWHFFPIRLQTWTPKAVLVSDVLISKKSSRLKLSSQMNRNLVGSTYGRFCIKFPPTEWKVSDTGSGHWASSLIIYCPFWCGIEWDGHVFA